MATVVIQERIEIPSLSSLNEFRAWATSDDFPDHGRIDYLDGRVEVDMSPEDFFTHGILKTAVASAIARRVAELDLGHTCIANTRWSDPAAELSAEPDILVVSYESLDSGRARLTPKSTNQHERYVEVVGAVDLIVEIVSDSSVIKDTQRLPAAYFKAGLREYWLIDARSEELVFQIHVRAERGLVPGPIDANGFQRSNVLDRLYELHATTHARGHVVYELVSE